MPHRKNLHQIDHDKNYGLSRKKSKEIIEALNHNDKARVTELLKPLHIADIADLIDLITHDQRKTLIDFIRKDFDAEILVELDSDVKEDTIELLGPKDSAKAIKQLDTDDAVDVIEDLDEEGQQEILEAIPKKQRAELEEGLSYPEDSAGRLLDRNIVTVPEFWNVGQTIDYLRVEKTIPDEFYQIFVVDPAQHPVGGVMLSRVMRSKRNVLMKDIMHEDLKIINAEIDQEEVAYIFRQYGLACAPVVNEEGRMIGVITIDDVVDVIDEEAHEDIMHLGGILEGDLYSDFVQTLRRRFPWLLINLVTAIIASIVIGIFEESIAKLAALAVLMPIVASMGGNAGTQTLTIAVRAIATRELTGTNARRVIGKEVLVGVLNGLLFAIITAVATYLWYGNLMLSMIFAFATIITLAIAGFAGATIPIFLVRIGVDPAIASSVVLTTITDVIAFGAFLGLAATILL